jgi:thioredoxin reductase (NADPH)
MPTPHFPVAIIGAGPIGLEIAWALKNAGVDYVHFDKNQVASTIAWFPEGMTFFSSPERIAICGVPLQTLNQTKSTKEQYLAYLRTVAVTFDLRVRTYEEVTGVGRTRPHEPFTIFTRTAGHAEHRYTADRIVLATGDMARPRLLNVPGEDLPHVSHYFRSPHPYFRRRLLVVGGKNSAVEAALRSWAIGADVTLSYRGEQFSDRSVKYWLLPELLGRIKRGEIACHYRSTPMKVTPTHTTLRLADGSLRNVEADFVLMMTGYVADTKLTDMLGVGKSADTGRPVVNESTMETDVPGVYVAGTATAGTQLSYTVFIENCHVHATRIAAAITGQTAPPTPAPVGLPES